MNKITFFVALLLCSSYSLALNLSNTYSKETKMSIKTLKDYQTYRLNQLEQLKAQGMDDITYFKEVEKVKNLVQPSPINIPNQLKHFDRFGVIERKLFEFNIDSGLMNEVKDNNK